MRLIVIAAAIFQGVGVILELAAKDIWFPIYRYFNSNSSSLVNEVYLLEGSTGYLRGFMYNPGYTAIALTNGIFCLILSRGEINGRLRYPMMGFLLMCVLLTGKRDSMLGVLLGIIVMYVACADNMGDAGIKVLRLSGVLLVIYLIGQYIYISEVRFAGGAGRVMDLLYSGREIETSGRNRLWEMAFGLYKSHPWAGIGWMSFAKMYTLTPHNIYLQVLCELGTAMFIVVVLAIAHPYFRALSEAGKHREAIASSEKMKGIFQGVIGYQTCFIFYSFFANSLWDMEVFYMYAFVLLIETSVLGSGMVNGPVHKGVPLQLGR